MGAVQYYKMFGYQVGSHYLAIATLVTTGLTAYGASKIFSVKAPSEVASTIGGPWGDPRLKIDAGSQEEEKFIQEWIREAENEQAQLKAKAQAKK